jgi:isopentenyl-diphosphate Delta-isomerase
MDNMVVLVDENDQPVGEMEKMEAHKKGLLHRAISVFVFDTKGNMLLQQRAKSKYHGAGLWSNTCCSHPFPGETPHAAANRRLQEEMGFHTPLDHILSFTYRAEVENGLIENEFDHVYAGVYDGEIAPAAAEVAAYRYTSLDTIREELMSTPEKFTKWFHIVFPAIDKWWEEKFS